MKTISHFQKNLLTLLIFLAASTTSVFLTTFAGYVGLVIGVGILEGVNYILASSGSESDMFKNPSIDFNMALTALVILVISGAVAGLIPARKAVSIKPIDALRYE